MVDLLLLPDVLDPATREAVVAALRQAAAEPTTVSGKGAGRGLDPHVRKASRAALPPETRALVARLLLARKDALAAHFGVPLETCEEPQFLRYQAGDFFVAHQDGNTPVVYDDTRFRKVSAVLFLVPRSDAAAPGTYGGGELVFHGAYPHTGYRRAVAPPPGTLVAFRAETTHEVLPVTHGERFTIVTWFR